MFPKHTQLQNSTLSIHTPDSNVSELASPPRSRLSSHLSLPDEEDDDHGSELVLNSELEGVGIISGFTPSSKPAPATPTAAERRKPALERSMSHQRSGLTSARVMDTCKVDDQASLR